MLIRRALSVVTFGRVAADVPAVAVVPMNGVIGAIGPSRRGLSMTTLGPALERLEKTKRLSAIALAVNSPGGSPVQSAMLARRVRAIADKHQIPLYAFCADVAASGGYWLALAADEIYADASSIIGSIGVISAGFGFEGLIEKLGVERRVHIAGERKGMLDPFKAEQAKDVRHLKAIQGEVHEQFKAMVRERRGDRLRGSEKDLFSGAFWTGGTALEKGLIDGIADLRPTMRERFGENVRFRVFGPATSPLARWFGRAGGRAIDAPFTSIGGELVSAVEERLIWNRFGL